MSEWICWVCAVIIAALGPDEVQRHRAMNEIFGEIEWNGRVEHPQPEQGES